MPYRVFLPRRLRESPPLRKMVRETTLGVEDLIYPLFAVYGRGARDPIHPCFQRATCRLIERGRLV